MSLCVDGCGGKWVCMYVYICMWVSVCMYERACVCVCVCVDVCVYECVNYECVLDEFMCRWVCM